MHWKITKVNRTSVFITTQYYWLLSLENKTNIIRQSDGPATRNT